MSFEVITPIKRLRRLRSQSCLRDLLSEHRLHTSDMVLPLFIKEGLDQKKAISSMPGHFQLSLNDLAAEIDEVLRLKIPAVILFGIPVYKDASGSSAMDENGIIAKALAVIKARAPKLLVITDLCFCEYTDHGHCGVVEKGDVDNDRTLALLVEQALVHAKAGADVIAPSGMMDGMIAAIRQGLDNGGFVKIPLLSYAVKFASAFYGPFREAAEGAPQFGDRKTYQMNPANVRAGLREAAQDVDEGADMLMVKPAQAYLDVIYRVKDAFSYIPLGAYQVSGEFAMIKAAAQAGWVDGPAVMLESLLSIKRAGADFIITYFAKDFAAYYAKVA